MRDSGSIADDLRGLANAVEELADLEEEAAELKKEVERLKAGLCGPCGFGSQVPPFVFCPCCGKRLP